MNGASSAAVSGQFAAAGGRGAAGGPRSSTLAETSHRCHTPSAATEPSSTSVWVRPLQSITISSHQSAFSDGAKLERTLGAVAPGLNLTQVASDILGLLVKRRDLDEFVDTHDPLLIPV